MRISKDLERSRLNMAATAELVRMHPGHLRRLIRQGVLPQPKRTVKGMPYFDYELLCKLADILQGGVGLNGQEITFYRRRPRPAATSSPRRPRSEQADQDPFTQALMDGLRQLGVGEPQLRPESVLAALAAEFGDQRPGLEVALPAVARRLLG